MTTPIIGELLVFVRWVYDVYVEVSNKITDYISTIFNVFPPDDSRKTLLMSFIWFVGTVIILILLAPGNVLEDGLGENPEGYRFSLAPGHSLSQEGTGEGGGNLTTPTTVPIQLNVECVTDEDCAYTEAGNTVYRKCCTIDEYSGYTCAGRCLTNEEYGVDACKHPGACFNNLEELKQNIKEDINRCDTKKDRLPGIFDMIPENAFCKNMIPSEIDPNQKNLLSTCCTEASPCYGYCTYQQPYNCWDINSCMYENIRRPVINEVGEVIP